MFKKKDGSLRYEEWDVCPMCGRGTLYFHDCEDKCSLSCESRDCDTCSFHYLQCDYCGYVEENS